MRSQISSSGGCRALDMRDMAGAGAAAPTVQPTALLLHCSPAEGSRTTAQSIIMDHLQAAVVWKSNPRYNHCTAVTGTAPGIASRQQSWDDIC